MRDKVVVVKGILGYNVNKLIATAVKAIRITCDVLNETDLENANNVIINKLEK